MTIFCRVEQKFNSYFELDFEWCLCNTETEFSDGMDYYKQLKLLLCDGKTCANEVAIVEAVVSYSSSPGKRC